MKIILTADGTKYQVDDEDFDELNQYTWWSTSRGHAQGYIDGEFWYMHQRLIEHVDGHVTDHRDRDPHNNQKHNLRTGTYSNNAANATKMKGTTSQYKGVSWYRPQGKWVMKFYENNRQVHGGYYEDEHEAARQYNAEMFRIHGEFANLNVTPEGT